MRQTERQVRPSLKQLRCHLTELAMCHASAAEHAVAFVTSAAAAGALAQAQHLDHCYPALNLNRYNCRLIT